MSNLLLHDVTKQSIERYLAKPTHALLLAAPEGSGKETLALALAAKLLKSQADKLREHQLVKVILPEKDKASISIEAVRELQHFTKLKLPGNDAKRVIIIPNAGSMTAEAQNALLKLLEEPPTRTYFILTAHSPQQLLATIRSRLQAIDVRRPGRAASLQHFTTHGFSDKDVQQAYLMSGGLIGLMSALLSDTDHPLKQSVETARHLLKSTQFERLAKVDELAKQKAETLQILFILRQMSSAAIGQAKDNQTAKRWKTVLQASYDAESALADNASAKLTLAGFMLAL